MVLFASASNLVRKAKGVMNPNQLAARKNSFEKLDLAILGDLGRRSLSCECGEVLFNLGRNASATIMASFMFDCWDEVFDNPVFADAIVDCIAYKAHVVDARGLQGE